MKIFWGVCFFVLQAVIAEQDWRKRKIPDKCTVLVFMWSVGAVWIFPEISFAERLAGAVAVSGFLLLLVLLCPGSFGGGDIKLMAAAGLGLGLRRICAAFVLAVGMAGVYALFELLVRRRGRKAVFAFGPFLCAGLAVGLLAGEEIFRVLVG